MERWFGRITERKLLETVNGLGRRAPRVEQVVADVTAEVKLEDTPIKLDAPKPTFLEPLC